MIAWLSWLLLAPLVLVLDGWLALQLPVHVDLCAVLCVTFGLRLRSGAVPGLVAATAVARALLGDGDLAIHFLALGVPVAVLLVLRVAFAEGSWAVQAVAIGVVALVLPRLGELAARAAGQPLVPLPAGFQDILATAVLGPWLLRAFTTLPPLRWCHDRPREIEVLP